MWSHLAKSKPLADLPNKLIFRTPWPPDRSVCAALLISSRREAKALCVSCCACHSRENCSGALPPRALAAACILLIAHSQLQCSQRRSLALELAIAKAKMCDSPLAEFLSCWPTQSAHFCAQRDEVYFFCVSGGLRHLAAAAVKSAAECRVCVSFYKHARQECLVFSVEPQHDNCYCTRSQRSPFSRRSDLGAPGALKNQFLLFRCAAHYTRLRLLIFLTSQHFHWRETRTIFWLLAGLERSGHTQKF